MGRSALFIFYREYNQGGDIKFSYQKGVLKTLAKPAGSEEVWVQIWNEIVVQYHQVVVRTVGWGKFQFLVIRYRGGYIFFKAQREGSDKFRSCHWGWKETL